MLEVKKINLSYGESNVLFDMSIKAEAGKITTILGRNGVGKTSLLKSIIGLENIKSGSIYLNKKSLHTKEDLVKLQISRGFNIVDIKDYQIQDTHSLGVLYLKNISDTSNEIFSKNLSEDIMLDFEKINDIRSSPKNIINKLQKNNDLNDISRRLKVNNILHGTISYDSDRVTLEIRLYNSCKMA